MKILYLNKLIVILALFVGGQSLAQTVEHPREKMWLPEIRAFQKQDSIEFPATGGILFVGSSSIRMWRDLPDYFPGYGVIQRGVGGSHLEDVIYFSPQIIFPYYPRQIVLYEGDNDIKDGFTPAQYLEEVKVFVRLMEIRFPRTPMIILSIKPSLSRNYLLDKYLAANRLLEAYAREKTNVTYVDITPSVMTPTGEYRMDRFLSDKLHINKSAYEEWARIITPFLIKQKDTTAPAGYGR